MAKSEYNIRKPINQGFLDTEISLSPGNDGSVRPRPIKWVLFWMLSLLALFYVIMVSPVGDASIGWQIAVVLWWIVATFALSAYGKTKEMRFTMVPSAVNYHTKGNREIYTRMTNDPSSFFSVAGYRSIDSTGQITFADGTLGRAYEVVGNASVLSFDDDKRRILDRVEQWWRKMDGDVELISITAKEPQRVDRQLVNLKRRFDNLKHRDPELEEILHEKFDIQSKHVGASFRSIHQYMIIKANHAEALRQAMSILTDEVRASQLVFRTRDALTKDDTLKMLSMFTRTETHRIEESNKRIVKGVKS